MSRSICVSASSDAQAIFDESNKALFAKDYEKACTGYEKLIAMDYNDPSVYFNLSNAYMFSGRVGKAVLNLHRAKELQPRGKDILRNINTMNNIVQKGRGGDAAGEPPFSVKEFVRSFSFLSKNELSIAIVVLYILFFVWSIVRRRFQTSGRKSLADIFGVVSCMLTLFFLFILAASQYYDSFNPRAVIMKNVEISSAPSDEDVYRGGVMLPEGAVVEIISVYDGWYSVKERISEKEGWVRIETMEKI